MGGGPEVRAFEILRKDHLAFTSSVVSSIGLTRNPSLVNTVVHPKPWPSSLAYSAVYDEPGVGLAAARRAEGPALTPVATAALPSSAPCARAGR